MKKNLLNFQVVLIVLVLLSSCSSYKSVPYFQDLNRASISKETIDNLKPTTVQPGDVLTLSVISASDEAAGKFNGSINGGSRDYTVDPNGNITLPQVGMVKVADLTVTQVHDILLPKLTVYLKDPILSVKTSGFKYSVLGAVKVPGIFTSSKEQLSFLDALSSAGDLAIFGRRENALLIREINGKREFVTLDLTKKDLFTSPYYYLKNNDIIYIEPDKEYDSENNSRANVTLGLSVISVVALIVSLIRR